MVTVGRVLRSDESNALELLRVEGLQGQVHEDVERLGEFGVASRPPAGSQVILLPVLGSRARLVAIACEDRTSRPKDLEEGEGGSYSSGGARVRCRVDGSIELEAPTGVVVTIDPIGGVTVDSPTNVTLNAAGGVTVNAPAVTLGAATTIDGKLFLAHTHLCAGAGNPSGPPL